MTTGGTPRRPSLAMTALRVHAEVVGWTLAGIAIVVLSIAVVAFRQPLVDPTKGAPVVRTTPSAAPAFRDGAPNLLRNGSFETESDVPGVAANWTKTDQIAEYAIDDRAKYGAHSQRITKTGTSDPASQYSSVIQYVNDIVGGHNYVVAVDYEYARQASPERPQAVGIVIFELDRDGKFIDDGTIIDWGWKETAQWVRKSVTFTTSAQAVTLLVQFRISVNGSLWLDGATLEDVTR